MPKFIISVMYDGFPGKYLVVTDFSYEADDMKSARDIFTSIVFSFNRNGYFLWESDPVRCYVKGNHDIRYTSSNPVGCENIHKKIVCFKSLNILGLEGSIWYNGEINNPHHV